MKGTAAERLRPIAPLLLLLLAASLFQRWSVWGLAGLLGDSSMTRERARALSSGRPAWFTTLALLLVIAPAMALHYALNFGAVGLPCDLLVLILTLDSALVGAMAILMGNIIWISYRDAQEVADVSSPLKKA